MAEADQIVQDARTFQKWNSEISYAQKDEAYKKWLKRSEQIVKRYRDERQQGQNTKRRYNILWSNVETLKGAVFGKMPKPIAERRFLDRDPSARLASTILERTLAFQMEVGGFNRALKRAVKDRLLPGMGVVWQRYEPEFESKEIAEENKAEEADDYQVDDEDGLGSVYEKLAYERVCDDYVYYRDFLWSPARCWDEVPWVAKRCWMDKSEAEEAFGEDKAEALSYGDPKTAQVQNSSGTNDPLISSQSRKAEVWEIWCKTDRTVIFISPNTPDLVLKEETDDPLKLTGFFPCQEPLFSTQTNDTLVPVPDYVLYQDQASELDTLTQRIAVVTAALRANGVYDSSSPELARLMQEGQDNKLIPVSQWAMFAEKGGMKGAVDLMPMDMIIAVLTGLYDARDRVKAAVDELTGISDVIRGVSDPRETASAQKIKSNYASGRLGTRQEEVADFCANGVRIKAEIICEVFSDQSLLQMSGVDQMNKDAIEKAVQAVQPPPPPPNFEQMPPELQQQAREQGMQQFEDAKRKAAQSKQQQVNDEFLAALKVLRSDKLRGFRVDIETDSTIADSMQEDKEAAAQFVQGLFQSIQGAEETLQAAPELVKPLGLTIMWAMRKYRVGRVLESTFEDAFDQIDARIEAQKGQPKPPDPEMIKAQSQAQLADVKAKATEAASQSDIQIAQITSQAETAKAASDLRIQEVQFQSEQAQAGLKSQIEGLKLQIEAQKNSADTFTERQSALLQYLGKVRVAEIAAGTTTNENVLDNAIMAELGYAKIAHEQTMQADQHAHEVQQSASDQQHQQTMQDTAPKPNATS